MDGYGPSLAEILQASYPDWLIWRVMLEDGGHGDWCAQSAHATGGDTVLRHATVEGLATLLEQVTATPVEQTEAGLRSRRLSP